MKLTTSIAIVVAVATGWFAAKLTQHTRGGDSARRVLYYQSPMHPWVKSDKAGQCTICGMELVPIYEGDQPFGHAAGSIVMLPQGSANVIGVQTAEVRKRPFVRTLRVAGMIGEDESRHGVISAA